VIADSGRGNRQGLKAVFLPLAVVVVDPFVHGL
jgi:hypothetical protein